MRGESYRMNDETLINIIRKLTSFQTRSSQHTSIDGLGMYSRRTEEILEGTGENISFTFEKRRFASLADTEFLSFVPPPLIVYTLEICDHGTIYQNKVFCNPKDNDDTRYKEFYTLAKEYLKIKFGGMVIS
jgi:hypothetical protein